MTDPFGIVLNGHDVDALARVIVEDVLDVQRTQQPGFTEIENYEATPSEWAAELNKPPNKEPIPEPAKKPWWKSFVETGRYTLKSVPLWQLILLGLWSGVVLGIAFAIDGKFEMMGCSGRWFCGLLSVNDDIKSYIGYALFLLLGARISQSHLRFAQAQAVWQGQLTNGVGLLANHILQSFAPGSFHKGDLERIMGHLAAVGIALRSSVRGQEGERSLGELRKVVGERDANAIGTARDPVAKCLDVLHAYVVSAERLDAKTPEKNGLPGEEYFVTLAVVEGMRSNVAECEAIARVRPPFGFQMHLRVLLTIWLFILPIGIVVRTGWLVVAWAIIVGFGVLGVRRWADELEDPFGCDEADLPVNRFSDEVVEKVKEYMGMFPMGAATFVVDGEKRRGLEEFEEVAKKEAKQGAKKEAESVTLSMT